MLFQAKGLSYGNFTGWNIYSNRVYNNATTTPKHGVYFKGYNTGGGCGQFRNINFYNNLIYNNGSVGYGIVVTAEDGCEADINIFNNTLYSNSHGIINASGSGTITNNIFVNTSTNITPATMTNANVIKSNNLTIAGDEGIGVIGSFSINDFVSLDSVSTDYLKLKATAVTAIDQGTNTGISDDYSGTFRPQGVGYDIGAFEYVSQSALFGDLNSDGIVDINDVQACVNHILGAQDWGAKADVNSDGAVNVLDVQAIVNVILGG